MRKPPTRSFRPLGHCWETSVNHAFKRGSNPTALLRPIVCCSAAESPTLVMPYWITEE